MINFMKKIPAGIVLIPMFLSALCYTLAPDLFKIGGFTQSIFTNQSLNFILGIACFVSGICLDLSIIGKILKKHGVLAIFKLLISVVFAILFVKLFGTKGTLGVSSLAFIVAICSSNPSIYLPIAESLGTKEDELAFGIVSLIAIPAIPLFVYGLTSTNIPIDYMPIISTLIPIIFGIIWGNLDKNARSYFSPLLSGILPFLGWAIGSNIRLDQAFKAGFSGIILLILFYLVTVPLLVLIERILVKGDGVVSVALNSVSGLSVSLPVFIGRIIPDAQMYQESATAQLTLCLIFTSILTPIIAKTVYRYSKK